MKFYKFTFADGHVMYATGLSGAEKRVEVAKHGKVISKIAV